MELDLEIMASVIDEQMEPDVQTKITNEIRMLAFQLRNLIATQNLDIIVKISQIGIRYSKDESVVTFENQFEIDTSTDEQIIADEQTVIESVDQSSSSNSAYQLQPPTTPITDRKLEKLINAIQYWSYHEYHPPMSLRDDLPVAEALQLQWTSYQQIATGGGPAAQGSLRSHYEIGHTLRRHQQNLLQQNLSRKEAEQQCKALLQNVTHELGYRVRYRASLRLMELFKNHPLVLQYLDPYLSVSYLGQMSRSTYTIYRTTIDDTVTELMFFGVVSNS